MGFEPIHNLPMKSVAIISATARDRQGWIYVFQECLSGARTTTMMSRYKTSAAGTRI